MPRRGPHPLDGLADELSDWLQTESDWYATALIGEHRTPFAANITEQEKIGAYRRMVFEPLPDGLGVDFSKPNIQGRQRLQERVGIDGYANIMRTVMPKNTMEHLQTVGKEQSASEEYEEPDYSTPTSSSMGGY